MDPQPKIKRFEDMSILVVDDQDFMRGFIRQMLQTLGCNDIRIAVDGRAAVNYLNGPEVDLILLDIHMDYLNGLEALAAIRAGVTQAKPYTPVIMLTGDTAESQILVAKRLKANAFLVKPVSLTNLTRAISELFGSLRPYPPLPLNREGIKQVIADSAATENDPGTRSLDYIFDAVPSGE